MITSRQKILAGAMLAASLLAATAPVAAAEGKNKKEKWEPKAIADKPQVLLDPAKAYVAVQGYTQITPMLMKRPSEAEATAHALERAEALAKEHAKWIKRHAQWVGDMKALASVDKSVRRPSEPQEPTEDNFSWPRYEQVHVVLIGPQFRFAKGAEGASTYLQEVAPGEYVYYGNTMGIGGTCACMGTVAFKAEAGKVTSLGRFWSGTNFKQRSTMGQLLVGEKKEKSDDMLALPDGVTTMGFEAAPFSDPRIPEATVTAAKFTPVDRMPNWFGLAIDRIMPIEGVFRYERDKQIDLTVAAAPAP